MIFGEFPCSEGEGVRLAHTLKLPQLVLKKGRMLSATDIAALANAGIATVVGARIAPDELDEDTAAKVAAESLTGSGLVARPPFTGRCNLYAQMAGVLCIDAECIHRLNRISETVTLATLSPGTVVYRDQRVATVKVIPFAVANTTLHQWRSQIGSTSPLSVLPLHPCRAALILSMTESTGERQLDMAVSATRSRIEKLGGKLALELRCSHTQAAIGQAISQTLAAGCNLLLIMGATISKDRTDVVPAAIVAAGGNIEHFGMPVEPGNMLLLARIAEVPVLNLPGCARSPGLNGIDLVLPRLLADLPLTPHDIMGMGVGGLIHSAESDEAPAAIAVEPSSAPAKPRIAVLVLAAGRSSRMAERNKLLCEVAGVPLVRRAVNAACASRAAQVVVVTGHQADLVEAVLVDRPLSLVRNPDYADGMATSLRCGLRALPVDTDAAIIMLADMPQVNAVDIDRLIAAFDPAAPAVLVPEHAGKRGNPVLWPYRYFAEMMALAGDTGARGLLEQYAANVHTIPFPDNAIFLDVDTPAALQALKDAVVETRR